MRLPMHALREPAATRNLFISNDKRQRPFAVSRLPVANRLNDRALYALLDVNLHVLSAIKIQVNAAIVFPISCYKIKIAGAFVY
jgi:hypothetical protein